MKSKSLLVIMPIGIVKEISQSISSIERGIKSELLSLYFIPEVGHRVPSKSDSIAASLSNLISMNYDLMKS